MGDGPRIGRNRFSASCAQSLKSISPTPSRRCGTGASPTAPEQPRNFCLMFASTPRSSLEILPRHDHAFFRRTGAQRLDEDDGRAVSQQLALLPDNLTGARLVLDLEGVQSATSTALGALVAFNRRVRTAGGQFALANVGPIIRETLAV